MVIYQNLWQGKYFSKKCWAGKVIFKFSSLLRHWFNGNTIEMVIIYTNEFHEWFLIYIIDNDGYEITRMFDYKLQQSSYYDYKNLAQRCGFIQEPPQKWHYHKVKLILMEINRLLLRNFQNGRFGQEWNGGGTYTSFICFEFQCCPFLKSL